MHHSDKAHERLCGVLGYLFAAVRSKGLLGCVERLWKEV